MDAAHITSTYLSQKPKQHRTGGALVSVVLFLVVYLIYHYDIGGLAPWLTASNNLVFTQGQFWRLLSTMAVHADVEHLLANIFYFAGLGYLLQSYFSAWVFPLFSFLGAALANAMALSTYPPEVTLLGASGGVYFMTAVWLSLYIGIERRLSLARRVTNAVAFALVLLAPTAFEARVSYRTHFFGFLFGLVFGALYFRIHRRKFRQAEQSAPESADPEWYTDLQTSAIESQFAKEHG